ncbi:hypothetical protein PIB30_065988 [Stylosanthes scabra]|uniref:Uncharacterized protein n=1 Tax=Stylosanthes scabra TaxID=79078 RepID=A0ABU6QM23_9FABA|nr:hypothetical protein [Stylosanthes scabra]
MEQGLLSVANFSLHIASIKISTIQNEEPDEANVLSKFQDDPTVNKARSIQANDVEDKLPAEDKAREESYAQSSEDVKNNIMDFKKKAWIEESDNMVEAERGLQVRQENSN